MVVLHFCLIPMYVYTLIKLIKAFLVVKLHGIGECACFRVVDLILLIKESVCDWMSDRWMDGKDVLYICVIWLHMLGGWLDSSLHIHMSLHNFYYPSSACRSVLLFLFLPFNHVDAGWWLNFIYNILFVLLLISFFFFFF